MGGETSRQILHEIRERAGAAHLLDAATGAYLWRVGLLLPLLLALLFIAWSAEGAATWIVAACLSGIASVQLGFVAHDAGHGAVSRRAIFNQIAGHLTFTIVNGLGFQSWRVRHDAHHAHCQDESKDPDMWVGTVMSLTPRSAAAKTGIWRRLLPYQGYYLWPTSLLFAHSLRVESLARWVAQPRRYALDAVLLPGHYLLWLVGPALGFGAGRVVLVYAIASGVMGLYLALLFWVNHVGMPAFQEGHGLTRLEQQVVATRNVRNRPFSDLLFGGLNLQIEHHLLPDCPSMRLRRLQSITRPLLLESSLPYREEGMMEALGSLSRHIFRIAKAAVEPSGPR